MDYSKISAKDFNEQLARHLDGMTSEEILAIETAHSEIKEELNNKVLERFDMIEEIHTLLNKNIYDSEMLTMGELESDADPIVDGTFYDGVVRILYKDNVDVTVYVDDVDSKTVTMTYEQLPTDTLESILDLLRGYDDLMNPNS